MISFLLPTNRPLNQFAYRVIDNINSLNFYGHNHEIILISTEKPIQRPNTIFIEDTTMDGCISALNNGFKHTKGDYIYLCSDDHFFDIDCILLTDFIEEKLKDKKYKIACLPTNFHGPCKLPEYTNCDGIIARFPVFRRDTIMTYMNGYICHPKFKHHYVDNWLGYWMYQEGEPTIECESYNMRTFYSACVTKYDTEDEKVFLDLIQKYKEGNRRYYNDT